MGPSMRREGWESRLAQCVEGARLRPFEWGVHDCATFAFDVVREMISTDPFAEYRGSYSNELGAGRALIEHEFDTVRGLADKLMGEEISTKFAQRGDIILVLQPERGETLGVCLGVDAVFVGESGLVPVPMSEAITAWRVG